MGFVNLDDPMVAARDEEGVAGGGASGTSGYDATSADLSHTMDDRWLKGSCVSRVTTGYGPSGRV
jgi:hypothetical protein